MDKIRFVKGRLVYVNCVNPAQIALKDFLISVYKICHLKPITVPEQIVNLDVTAPEGKYDLCFTMNHFNTNYLASNR